MNTANLLNAKHYDREAKEENGIRDPKSILWAMRKDCAYFESKLRMLHKLKGLNSLSDQVNDRGSARDWFKGYHTFSTKKSVLDRFYQGRPLSCFCLDGSRHEVHVAVLLNHLSFSDCSKTKQDKKDYDIAYLTFSYDTDDWYNQEGGMDFCKFKLTEDITCANKRDLNVTDYALMLPFTNKSQFHEQFTLIYSDWEVLICDDLTKKKGPVPISHILFDMVVHGGSV